MPEPGEAVHRGQDERVATAPQQHAADKPTIAQPNETKSSIADFLDIPKEVQAQLKPRVVQPMEGDIPASHRALAQEAAPPAEEPPSSPAEPEPELESEPELEPEEEPEERPAAETEPQRIDKRQKRINRLTRQRNEALDQVDELKRRVENYEGEIRRATEPTATIPSATPWLHYIGNEPQLNAEVAKAESLIDWCDDNPGGIGLADTAIAPEFKARYQSGEITQEEAAQQTVAKWRRDADKIVRGAPSRREELRGFGVVKGQTDMLAQQAWPEMFDKSTQEHQLAQSLLAQFPGLRTLPQANYAVGLVIEGAKALQAKLDAAQARNGGVPSHRDISERAFAPRVPLAPHTAEPPSREVKPSSHKKLNEAMSNLVSDVDGSAASLAQMFAALEKTRATRAGSRTPVSV